LKLVNTSGIALIIIILQMSNLNQDTAEVEASADTGMVERSIVQRGR